MTSISVEGAGPLEAWIQAVEQLLDQPNYRCFHLTARMSSDKPDRDVIERLNAVLEGRGKQPIATVANTIFPNELGKRYGEVSDLGERYRRIYPTIRRYRGNEGGTYFGRLVDYPSSAGRIDQLAQTVEKMRREVTGGRKTSIYECAVYHPERDAGKLMGFPCMSSCSFHVDHHERQVLLLANYRNHYFFERALGNYIGLRNLLDYVARAIGFLPGELLVTSGYAKIEVGANDLRPFVSD